MSEAASDQVRQFIVAADDDGIRLDRWFKRNLPDASFNLVSRWARTGQLRLDGKRAAPGDRIEAGQLIRVPPAEAAPAAPQSQAGAPAAERGRDRLRQRDGDPPRSPRRSSSTSRPASPPRAAPRPTSISTACSTASPTRPATGPSWSTGSTRIRRACCSLARTAARRRLLLEELLRPHRAQGLLGAGRRRARGEGRHDRPAARQAARHRRREDACRRGGGPAVAHPLPGDRAGRQPRRLGRAPAADRPHPPAARPYGGDRPSDRRRRQIWRPGRLPDRRDQPQAPPPRPPAAGSTIPTAAGST